MIFLSQHSMGPKLSYATVAKTVKCVVTQQWNISSNKQKIEVIQFDLLEHEQLLTNRMNKLFLSLNNSHSLQLETLQTSWRRQELQSKRELRLNEAAAKYNRPFIKAIGLTEVHRKNRFKWTQDKTKLRIGNRWSFQTRQSFV